MDNNMDAPITPEESDITDEMCEEQDYIMLMLGNASYHYFEIAEKNENGLDK